MHMISYDAYDLSKHYINLWQYIKDTSTDKVNHKLLF